MKPHPHAQLAQQYWKEAEVDSEAWRNWEYENGDGKWRPLKSTPLFSTDCQYRRRPRTIRIGEYDVPEPLREAPEVGTNYWFVSILKEPPTVDSCEWDGAEFDYLLFERGMIHLTEEAAKIHAEALISLTRQ